MSRDTYFVLICACGHDEYSHGRKVGPYLLCSTPGCKCADRNYVRSELRVRPSRLWSPHRGELVTGQPGEVARNREDQRKHKAKLEAGK